MTIIIVQATASSPNSILYAAPKWFTCKILSWVIDFWMNKLLFTPRLICLIAAWSAGPWWHLLHISGMDFVWRLIHAEGQERPRVGSYGLPCSSLAKWLLLTLILIEWAQCQVRRGWRSLDSHTAPLSTAEGHFLSTRDSTLQP